VNADERAGNPESEERGTPMRGTPMRKDFMFLSDGGLDGITFGSRFGTGLKG
jgi:hypothetical protein